MKCQTVAVTIEGTLPLHLVIPAYTGPDTEARLRAIVERYITLSNESSNPMSMGDFAFFVLNDANHDPYYVETGE